MHATLRNLLLPPLPIGIDLCRTGAKLVQIGRDGRGLKLLAAARVEPEPNTSAEGDRDDGVASDSMLRAIARRVVNGGFQGRRCVVSVDDRLVRSRAVRVVPMTDAELEKAVRLDAPARLGFASGDPLEIGWLRAGEVRHGEESREEVIYLAAATAPLERLAGGLASAGLTPVAIEPAFAACARCLGQRLRRASDAATVRLIVDVGAAHSDVLITRGRHVAFRKAVEIGGDRMTEAAAERIGLDVETVADLRRRRVALGRAEEGEPIDPKVDRAVYDAIRPLIEDLAHEATLCLRHFSVTFRGARPEGCVLVGGDAAEPGLREAIAEALRLPTDIADPFEGMDVTGWSRWAGPEWAVAAGLSLRPTDGRGAHRSSRSSRPDDLAPGEAA